MNEETKEKLVKKLMKEFKNQTSGNSLWYEMSAEAFIRKAIKETEKIIKKEKEA